MLVMQKISNKQFQQKVYQLSNGEYEFTEPYKGSHEAIGCRHTPCNHHFTITPANFYKRKLTCPICKPLEMTFTMNNGKVRRLVKLRCEHKHVFRVYNDQIPQYLKGLKPCPICEKLKHLDPLYANDHPDFSFELRLLRGYDL